MVHCSGHLWCSFKTKYILKYLERLFTCLKVKTIINFITYIIQSFIKTEATGLASSLAPPTDCRLHYSDSTTDTF